MNIHRLYGPFLSHFRRGRLRTLYRILSLTEKTRVLDIGGSREFWMIARAQGLPVPQVTVINLRPDMQAAAPPRLEWVLGDAGRLPFPDLAFEAAISNSVIEHLGDRTSQERFASEVRRVAGRYFVQTPDRFFPIEPHFMTPFIHWFPPASRRRLLRNFSIWGLVTRPTQDECNAQVSEIRLLSAMQLRTLFPECRILRERFLGLSKSLIAVKAPTAG